MTLNTVRFEAAIRDFRKFSKLEGEALLKQQARGFVRRVVGITPPASQGVTGSSAKKAGELSIIRDLGRLFIGVQIKGVRKETNPDLAAIHAGAGFPVHGGNPAYVDKTKLLTYCRLLISRVGWLAAGWNSSARRLGVKLPAWIERHGEGAGSVQIVINAKGMRITMRNKVKFSGEVKGYQRRAQAALDYQADAMQRQIAVLIKKASRRAGFR